ncbi:MAG TPA: serine acetyltransferase [Erysipelotrichaceae bacterium]|nr:serine acetyltransferase [Erysipelotrichaceae bacterium]
MIAKNKLRSFSEYSLAFIQEHNDGSNLSELFFDAIDNSQDNCAIFINKLKEIKKQTKLDLDFFYDSDPAANSKEEIKLAYPGFRTIGIYRISHVLYVLGYVIHARYLSEVAHSETGIDIHPGATISYPFFIDHGTGIVIGQTCVIGQKVKIYQSVTLGAISLSNAEKLRGVVRHPQIGNNVTIYAGASLLGPIHIGDNVTIGSNVFLTEDVPSNTKVIIDKPQLIYINK